MADLKIQIPASFEMKVFIINDETNQSGAATIDINSLSFPTEKSILERIKQFEETEMIGGLAGFRLMTKEESWEYTCVEKFGETLAMPNGGKWFK